MTEERQRLIDSVRTAVTGQQTEQDILQAAVRMIDAFSEHYNWTGVYLMCGNHLEVGPYIGPPTPHTHIELNTGICGAAATQRQSIIVPDINAEPRFLACSTATRSEIVVPLLDGDACLGEIDIDSNQPDYFTDEDRRMLETIADIIVARLKEIKHAGQ